MEPIDTEKLTTVDAVDEEITKRKDTVCRKVKLQGQTKQEKKDAAAGYRDVLKQLEEEINFEMTALDELNMRRNYLIAKDGNE